MASGHWQFVGNWHYGGRGIGFAATSGVMGHGIPNNMQCRAGVGHSGLARTGGRLDAVVIPIPLCTPS